MNKSQNTDIPVITLDGDAGAGKGTTRILVAQRLAWNELDSGVLYRLVAYLGQDSPTEDHYRIIAQGLVGVRMSEGKVFLFDRVLTDKELRTSAMDAAAAKVARDKEVRLALREIQERARSGRGLVTDGRDMGTIFIAPNVYRFYLTADAEVRARRRVAQDLDKDVVPSVLEVRRSLEERDLMDKTRAVSPLTLHPEAVVVDTTHMKPEEVAEHIISIYKSKAA
ncbi:MAG: (d)CMP kinase [Patescibacteria group bacterium]